MALGADDGKTACITHDTGLFGANLLGFGERRLPLLVRDFVLLDTTLGEDITREILGIAAEQDIRTTTGHVGGNGDGTGTSGLCDDVGLLLVKLRVEDRVLDAALGEQRRKALGALDGDGADQAGLLMRVALRDVVCDGVELGIDRAIDKVGQFFADDGPVGGNHLDGKLVDVAELGVLGLGRTGHARELVVQAEIVLQRDGGHGLVLGTHEHALFGLDRLVQAFGIATTFHDAARELVDNLDLAVLDDVVLIAMEEELRLERLVQMVGKLAGDIRVDVLDAEQRLHVLETFVCRGNGALGLVHLEVNVLHEVLDRVRELAVGIR